MSDESAAAIVCKEVHEYNCKRIERFEKAVSLLRFFHAVTACIAMREAERAYHDAWMKQGRGKHEIEVLADRAGTVEPWPPKKDEAAA